MSAIGSGYDLSVTTYSRDGRLYQIEYAAKAVENSGTAIGVKCRDGVVLGVENLVVSKMLTPESNRRISAVDYSIGMAACGFPGDAKQFLTLARKEAREYRTNWAEQIPGRIFVERCAGIAHYGSLYGNIRPFGLSPLIACYDDEGPGLYMIEPSGVSFGYFACAVGKGSQAAKAELEKVNWKTMSCRDAVNEIARVIYLSHEESKDKDFRLELGWVCDETEKKFVAVPSQLVTAAEERAKAIVADAQ